MEKRGKIITIEGGDGTGKKTQTGLLVERLRKEGYDVETLSFPQYETPTGKIVTAYLRGEFGSLNAVSPKIASAFYAADRLAAQKQIKEWLEQGKLVVLDRYYESNMAHQGAKSPEQERQEFIKWVYEFEVHKLGILTSNLVILLTLPLDIAEKAMINEKRDKDIHESDINYAREVHKTYIIASKLFDWKIIDCMSGDASRRLTEQEVSEKVWNVVKENL